MSAYYSAELPLTRYSQTQANKGIFFVGTITIKIQLYCLVRLQTGYTHTEKETF